MACSWPLRGVRVGDKVVIKKRSDLIGTDLGTWIDRVTGEVCEPFDVPCKKCLQCRLDYAREWANRCMLEAKCWPDNFFVTLTYDDDNLKFIGNSLFPTLFPRDFDLFKKRLLEYYRERNHTNIRFYMAGEYGDISMRPHYHMCGFNLPVNDLVLYSKSPLGDLYFNSPSLSKLWGKGHVVIGELTEQSAAYVARYCQKKATKNIDYADLGIAKEYVRMSRRPGIGGYYFEEHADEIYSADKIYLDKGKICSPPRYFDNLAEKRGINLDRVKSDRRIRAELRGDLVRNMVSEDFNKYMLDLEAEFSKKAKSLRRNL